MKIAAGLVASLLFAFRAAADCTGCFNPSFSPPIAAYQAGFVKSFAAGDLNGDGVPDVAAAVGDGIGILVGTGSGRLSPMTHYDSAGSDSILVGDFDGDGRLDVAAAGDGNVSIFLGNGDGTLQAPIENLSSFYGSTAIASADFNGDGIPDVALQAFSLFTIWVYFGNGDGTLQPPIALPNDFYFSVSVGDFNGDGNPDLLAGGPTSMDVFLGDGRGGFSSSLQTPLSGSPVGVGDFDRDGLDDLALGTFDGVTILRSNGDGTFTTGASYSAPLGLGGIAAADMNRDGILDLVLTAYQTGLLYVFSGVGDGTFGAAATLPVGDDIGPVLVADFDRNGWPDVSLVIANLSVEVALVDDSGNLPKPNIYPTGGTSFPSNPDSITTGAFTAAGKVDAAVADVQSGSVDYLPGDGAGGFGAPIVVALSASPASIAAGSFHAPGLDDIAVATGAGIQVVLSNGDGTFQALPPFGEPSYFVVAADFDGDGNVDLAWLGSELRISLGNGDGTFAAGPPVPGSPSGNGIFVGDFNGDHKPDLILQAAPNFTVFLGDGNGGFAVGNTYGVEGNTGPLAVGDFDGDGKVDVAYPHNPGDLPMTVSFFWGNGDGTFGPPTDVLGNFQGIVPVTADVNADGLDDLVFIGYTSVRAIVSHGDRTFSTADWVTPTQGGSGTVADLDGDGKPEILTVGSYPPVVAVLRNTICVPARLVVTQQPSSCDASGAPFAVQPVVSTVDGGDNVMTCEDGTVVAALVPGTGAPGGVLSGQTAVASAAGVATFTDLSVDRPGMHYVLEFSSPVGTTQSRTFTQDLGVVISGLAVVCDGTPAVYRTGSRGYDGYRWSLDGAPISRAPSATLTGAGAGSHSVGVSVIADGCIASTAIDVEVQPSPPAPTIIGPDSVRVGQTGVVGTVTFHQGNDYLWTLARGTITGGQGTSQILFDAGPPGTTMFLSVVESSPSGCASPVAVHAVQVDFADAASSPFREQIDTVARNGISSGCGGGNFCPSAPVTRAQMAVFLLKAEHGPGYVPVLQGQPFGDVPPEAFAAAWINQLFAEGIVAGCGNFNYCPDAAVTRAQMAVMLLKTEHGSAYAPPPCTGVFDDVACSPSPAFAVDWIEQLLREGVTAGCGGGNYCPDAPNTRGQMAAFLTRAFNLQ